jgi:hypothetical protein
VSRGNINNRWRLTDIQRQHVYGYLNSQYLHTIYHLFPWRNWESCGTLTHLVTNCLCYKRLRTIDTDNFRMFTLPDQIITARTSELHFVRTSVPACGNLVGIRSLCLTPNDWLASPRPSHAFEIPLLMFTSFLSSLPVRMSQLSKIKSYIPFIGRYILRSVPCHELCRFKLCSQSRNSPQFMELEGSLPQSQVPASPIQSISHISLPEDPF